MNCKLQITVFIAILLSSLQSMSQGSTLHGKVLDAHTHKAIALATVRLQSAERKVLQTAITDTNGVYYLNNIIRGSYTLTFSALNYRATAITWKYGDTISNVLLEPTNITLKEVAVSAEKPIIRQKAGKIIYDMQVDPESRSSSVLNMMRKIPFISLDGNNNLLLKGNSDFRVFLNGKPSGMFERDLKNMLNSMPASTIQSIEVYTVPPARFDAEGAGGIINIITVRNINNELKGNLNLNQHWPTGGPGAGASATFKKDRFGFSAFTGGSINKTPATENSNERNTYGNAPTKLKQQGKDRSNIHSGYAGLELSYEVDSLDLITGRFNYYNNKTLSNSELNSSGGGLQQYHSESESKNKSTVIDAGVDYQRSAKADKNRILTLSYRHTNSTIKPQTEVLISGADKINFQQQNDQQSTENTLQLDYVYPTPKLMIEAGVKGIFRLNNSDFKYLSRDSETKNFELIPAYSDVFTYRQTVWAFYNSYSYNHKSWSFQGGIRVEKTSVDGHLTNSSATVEQDYVNVFPNLAINKSFDNGHSLNFGFSQRMKRPGINRLNPFEDRQNPDFISTGNPNLKPVTVSSISAGYNIPGKVNFNTGLDYSFIHKLYLPVSQYDTTTKITTTSFANTGSVDAISLFINASYAIKRLNISANGNLMYFWLKGLVGNEEMKTGLFTYSLNISSSYKFEKGWRARIDGSLISNNPTGFQGTVNGMITSTFGLSKSILNDKLLFDASVNNPFSKYRESKTFTDGPDFYQVYTSQRYFRTFNVSVDYKFGGLKGNLKRNKRTIKNNDLSNGRGM